MVATHFAHTRTHGVLGQNGDEQRSKMLLCVGLQVMVRRFPCRWSFRLDKVTSVRSKSLRAARSGCVASSTNISITPLRSPTVRGGCCCLLRPAISRHLSTVSQEDEIEESYGGHSFFTSFSRIIDGPGLQLGFGKIANQTSASVVGRSGSTILLTTAASQEQQPPGDDRNHHSSSLLTVDYRQRYHGVGNIPMTNRHRRDNAVPSTAEILGSRAVDRALRPCLQKERLDLLLPGLATHVHATVQSYPLLQNSPAAFGIKSATAVAAAGNPVAMAINTASAALYHANGDASALSLLSEPVAAVCWGVGIDGTLIQDPTPYTSDLIGTLLYAGTRDRAVMMEWTSFNPTSTSGASRTYIPGGDNENITIHAGLSQCMWPDLLNFAQASLGPMLDTIEEFSIQRQQSTTGSFLSVDTLAREEAETEEIYLRKSLGLPISLSTSSSISDTALITDRNRQWRACSVSAGLLTLTRPTRKDRMQEAIEYCEGQLGNSLALLFGSNGSNSRDSSNDASLQEATHHEGDNLMSKKLRGRREALMQQEVGRVLQEFLEANDAARGDEDEDDVNKFRNDVIHALFQRALCKAATRSGSRADGRGPPGLGWKTIRPIRAQAPTLPEVVHGSALFSRGDTQVLCTVTLGPPRHGATPQDAYEPKSDYTQPMNQTSKTTTVDAARAEYNAMPVGSIRFLRSQEAMVSDLNSRNVKADKERTGDSGSLAEVKRAFLQYDFPPYSTGELPRGSVLHNRRAIGHGDLAERAILPVLPSAHDFPYAIRMTAEVTDSNGSSSMASVCGSVLALLDAGVPLTETVAGISVGLAMEAENEDAYSLLLDITGTEDHYGAMDFKIAGTRDGVTAVQLDVKRPLPVSILLQAMELAKSGRGVILDQMEVQTHGLRPRPEPKESAPRVEVVRFHPSRKRDLIGPGGVVLRQLEDRFGVSIDLTQEGQCLLFGSNRELVSRAKSTVMDLVADVVEGNVYEGTVLEVKDFGAILELLRNKEGLLHVSEVTNEEEARDHPGGIAGFVRQYLRVGQKVEVLCIGVDPVQGSIKLSRKALLDRTRRKNNR